MCKYISPCHLLVVVADVFSCLMSQTCFVDEPSSLRSSPRLTKEYAVMARHASLLYKITHTRAVLTPGGNHGPGRDPGHGAIETDFVAFVLAFPLEQDL
jgi:hypothetical protein